MTFNHPMNTPKKEGGADQAAPDKDALDFLGIADFRGRIMASNSHGEQFHLMDCVRFAEAYKDNPEFFRTMFLLCVEIAEKNWNRPESVFQHMPRMMSDVVEAIHRGSVRP